MGTSPAPFIDLDAQNGTVIELGFGTETADFTVGETITGGSSGATAIVEEVIDGGTSGTLRLSNLSGTFQSGEAITGSATGSALATSATREIWRNTGAGGAAYDVTVTSGTIEDTRSNFGSLGSAFQDVTGQLANLTAISTDDATLEFWFKPDSSGSGKQILFETGGSGTGMSLAYDNDLGIVIFKIDGGTDTDTNQQIVAQASGITPNEFNHLVAIYDRDAVGGEDILIPIGRTFW